jgi:hypothetical protein
VSNKQFSWMAGLFVACLPLAACAPKASVAEESENHAVKVEAIEGSELKLVTLTAQAAQRLDIQTTTVRSVQVKGTLHKAVPYAAILYDTEGNTWVYTSTDGLAFVRARVTIDYVAGDVAFLSSGPALGTMVVTVGAAELFGSEQEFEEE